MEIDAVSVAIGIGLGMVLAFLSGMMGKAKPIVNLSIDKTSAKVVLVTNDKEISDKVAASEKGVVSYCRCWRSKTFPLCDGSHAKHNTETGDNVGPLVVKKA